MPAKITLKVSPGCEAGYKIKLIFCPHCLDMKKVRRLELRRCACGRSWGYYLEDDLTAVIGSAAVPVAIENDELREAIAQRPKEGRGSLFYARVLPEKHDTLRRRAELDPAVAEVEARTLRITP
jgi:hypothetical protein